MTQKAKVLAYLNNNEATSIKEISDNLNILEPNVRRVLGVGAKEGIFERIAPGVYRVTIEGKELLYIYEGDATEVLPTLIEKGIKADNIFLDVPYDTPAVKGGNRGVKYELMSVSKFRLLLDQCNTILRDQSSTITYMFSNAESGKKAMQKYTDCFIDYGFTPVLKGEYYKLFSNGAPTTNMRGDIIKPEGIIVWSKVAKLTEEVVYRVVRPKGYQTEKAGTMINDLIQRTTKEGDTIIDPCCGSGVVGREGIKLNRVVHLIDKSGEAIKYTVENLSK